MSPLNYFEWSSLIGPLTTIGVALLAYLLGQRTYRNQKEYELVRSRYLDGGVDRFAANVDYALGAVRHNFARTLQILKLFRDVHIKESADLATRSSFRLIEPEKLDLLAGYRVQMLTGDTLYGRAHGLLFGFSNAAENFFVNDAGALIRLVASGEISITDKPQVFERVLAEAQRYQSESDRFYKLFYRLQELGRLLERRHLSFRELDEFRESPEVKAIGAKLLALFPPETDETKEPTDKLGANGT